MAIKNTMSTYNKRSGGTRGASIDMKSVINTGNGPLSPKGLAKSVSNGKISMSKSSNGTITASSGSSTGKKVAKKLVRKTTGGSGAKSALNSSAVGNKRKLY